MTTIGVQALFNIFVNLLVLVLTWWALQSLKFDLLFRHPKSWQARICYILLALAISHPVAQFLIDYMNWSLMLPHIYG